MSKRLLLVDNYDSFTYNLFHLICKATGVEPLVIKNDDPCWSNMNFDQLGGVVVSPGAGRPGSVRDVGCAAEIIESIDIPVLGVCLGHQLLAHHFGGLVARAGGGPMHGRVSDVHHAGDGLFAGLPSPFRAVRYHSLAVERIPECLEATAHADDGTVMALQHRTHPLWGVQFHPESVATQYGERLLANFCSLAERSGVMSSTSIRSTSIQSRPVPPAPVDHPAPDIAWRRLTVTANSAMVFQTMFAQSANAFWLDSALSNDASARFSYMGDTAGPDASIVQFDAPTSLLSRDGQTQTIDVFDYLDDDLSIAAASAPELPFDFQLGYVGYLGYELKGLTGGEFDHASPFPDAYLIKVDRMVVFDHLQNDVYLVAHNSFGTDRWFDATEVALTAIDGAVTPTESQGSEHQPTSTPTECWRHDDDEYQTLIRRAQDEIKAGESYEICLTNTATVDPLDDPLSSYLRLRRATPTPMASFLRLGALAVLSASPEQFVRVQDTGEVLAKPIKGTARRSSNEVEDSRLRSELANSAKDQAENLMIVDLLRNDLGSVCEAGSIAVPRLFDIESYATVHQMVSTVTGRLRPTRSAVDCLRAAFPPGSMTGAPKVRTMEILGRLEGGPRGIYSGAIGYFSTNGAANWSVVIRTIVSTAESATVGAGGAITTLSEADAELDEVKLKARATLTVATIKQPERR